MVEMLQFHPHDLAVKRSCNHTLLMLPHFTSIELMAHMGFYRKLLTSYHYAQTMTIIYYPPNQRKEKYAHYTYTIFAWSPVLPHYLYNIRLVPSPTYNNLFGPIPLLKIVRTEELEQMAHSL